MSAGIQSGIAPMANMESMAPNCSLLRRFKTSGSVENTCSILGARGVPRAASTYCIKYANCSAVTFEYGFDSICWKVACSSAGVNWLKDIRARAWLDSSVYASAYFRPATAMKNGFAARRYYVPRALRPYPKNHPHFFERFSVWHRDFSCGNSPAESLQAKSQYKKRL